MQETLTPIGLLDSNTVNPHDIGVRPTSGKSMRFEKLRNIIFDPVLNQAELEDLRKIDTGDLTLERIQLYAINHVRFFESYGRVRFNTSLQVEYDEAKKLVTWLEQKKYSQASAFFLAQAKKWWRGSESMRGNDDYIFKFFDGEDVAKTPESVLLQGDSAVERYRDEHVNSQDFRLASSAPAMQLKQAAVLARLL